jgi:putative ABC transport system permease protein
MLDAFVQDVRHAVRALRTNPGFAAVAILSLALGIGANTAIFTLINAVMLKPLPVHHPEELVQVTMGKPEAQWFSNPIWEQIRDRQDVFPGHSPMAGGVSISRPEEKPGTYRATTFLGSSLRP